MSEYVQVILLATIQGIAEFLPISSSGHLVVFGKLFEKWLGGPGGGHGENIVLNVALHVGTLGSILVVYRRDLWSIWKKPRLCLAIVLATIPAAVIGLTLKKKIEATFEQPLVVACGWLVTAGLLWVGQRIGRNERTLDELGVLDAVKIGCFQALALFRGVSRSGSSIAGGLFTGYRRDAAASFSFLIAIPAIGGAAVVEGASLAAKVMAARESTAAATAVLWGGYTPSAILVGVLVSFLVGLVSLRWLLRVITERGLNWFVVYCLLAAAATFTWQGYEHFAAR